MLAWKFIIEVYFFKISSRTFCSFSFMRFFLLEPFFLRKSLHLKWWFSFKLATIYFGSYIAIILLHLCIVNFVWRRAIFWTETNVANFLHLTTLICKVFINQFLKCQFVVLVATVIPNWVYLAANFFFAKRTKPKTLQKIRNIHKWQLLALVEGDTNKIVPFDFFPSPPCHAE